ncbi:TetR/AcrR family transcriptional regulator [Xanthobacter dioxanivorans]|uniref:TetR/AcrR family transcriptional regulator n=1 Tax=Xanthobacter dioxanivorans TaxID=2528964 RepID=A0A974PQ68_9HYPH|nr:TetR/AcrR family transcriptional regulator [Xanthobacter dioxanivorans]QRG07722.1 TetR/AcrR family transcriptional regulator [Xanthobacter dioxanivorans]
MSESGADGDLKVRAGNTRESLSAAGQDPEKRNQILVGARDVFFDRGFDAASMGDIARAAGVSKGTLYVYFENKEDLFAALVASECEETAERMFVVDAEEEDVETALTKLGYSFIHAVLRPSSIALLRTVIAISAKFPDIGRQFFEAGPCEGVSRLSRFLAAKVEQGVLDIDDVDQAASQFLTLCKDGVTIPVLVGAPDAPDPESVAKSVRGAVRVFMRAYGADRCRPDA